MSTVISASQMHAEVQRVTAWMQRCPNHGGTGPQERIASQSRDLYRPPPFLAQTAVGRERQARSELFDELWAINQDHVGERRLEVEVHYALTGAYRPLSRSLRCWSETCFTHRSDPQRYRPSFHRNQGVFFLGLVEELQQLLGNLSARAQTINYVFLDEAVRLGMRLVFGRTQAGFIDPARSTFLAGEMSLELFPHIPSNNMVLDLMEGLCERFGLFWEPLRDFLYLLGRGGLLPPGSRAPIREQMLRRLRDRMADIQETRPFLMPRWHPEKHLIRLASGRLVAWQWHACHGLANLQCAYDAAEMYEVLSSQRCACQATVGYEGLLIDPARPWHSAADLPSHGGVDPLG